MTITEKILAAHAGKEEVRPGDLIEAKVDLVMANDITAAPAIAAFEKIGVDNVWDPERVVLVPSHFAPARDIASAAQIKRMREFARRLGIKWFFELGQAGIEHALLPEQGLAVPGMLILGADSHSCTYGALGAFSTGVGSTDAAAAMATGETWLRVPESNLFVFHGKLRPWVSGKDLILYTISQVGDDGCRYQAMEFTGEAIRSLSMEQRMTITNMAIEAGAKSGIIAPDETTLEYVRSRAKFPWTVYQSDPDAHYYRVFEWDASELEPQVSFPHLPSNTKPLSEAAGIEVDQVVIGSCTNGRIEDLRIVAEVMRGRKVHPRIRCIIFPATPEVYRQALREGLIDVFVEAGAVVSTSTCGPCLGGHMGVLAEGERCLSTTNRNYVGRMGHPKSYTYLANPAVAAATAVAGVIAAPDDVIKRTEVAL